MVTPAPAVSGWKVASAASSPPTTSHAKCARGTRLPSIGTSASSRCEYVVLVVVVAVAMVLVLVLGMMVVVVVGGMVSVLVWWLQQYYWCLGWFKPIGSIVSRVD